MATATAESSSLSAFSLANLSAAAFFSSSVSSSATSPPAGLSSALSASSAGLSASSSGFAGSGIAAPVLRSLPLESLSSASFYSAVLPVEAALALKKSTSAFLIVCAKFLAPQTLSLSLVPAAYWVTKPVVFQI